MIGEKMASTQLSAEEYLFLNILKDHLNKTASKIPDSLNWNELIDIARKQDALGILYYQLKGQLDNSNITINQKVKLFKVYANSLLKYDKRVKALDEIDREFNKNKIPYFIFKGIEIAKLYPNPKLRTMGDSDILIHRRDRKKAHRCLLELGFQNDCLGKNEWKYHRDEIHIELHRKMMNYEAANSLKQVVFFSRRWKYAAAESNSEHCHLDWNYHFIYVLTHLRKHFINRGVGFRQFMDITVIMKECSLDWRWIKRELIKMDMWEFTLRCLAFCEMWFGIESPVEKAEIADEFYLESSKRIFLGGVFGIEDERNLPNHKIYVNRKARKMTIIGKCIKKIGLVFSISLFPPYDYMKTKDQYSFLKNKPYLLPAAWIYRMYRGLSGKADRFNNPDFQSMIKEQSDDRNSLLDKWMI